MKTATSYTCKLIGLGAWGPGFNNWSELKAAFEKQPAEGLTTSPKPEIIPANERRRSPLAVRAAVEISWQALQESGLSSPDVACVFGSGLGDTEITDYMCRVLTTDEKQLSPTKFHNSVHNAAAGYWTISSGCMKSANSIAAYHETAGTCLLEAALQSIQHNEPVLITLFDIAAQPTWQQIFHCEQSFAASILICPQNYPTNSSLASLKFSFTEGDIAASNLPDYFQSLYQENPAAKILPLLQLLAEKKSARLSFPTGVESCVELEVSPESSGDSV
jgi:hypothetical protein